MKYFKLELMNREENFNKMFNRSPTVGVMQVVKPKGPGGAVGPATAGGSFRSGLPPLGAGGAGAGPATTGGAVGAGPAVPTGSMRDMSGAAPGGSMRRNSRGPQKVNSTRRITPPSAMR